MKRFTLITTLVMTICVAATLSGYAQVLIGPRLGVNLASQKSTFENQTEKGKTNLRFSLGVVAQLELSDNMFFQPGLLLSGKGSSADLQAEDPDVSIDGYDRTNISYLEIPLNGVLKFEGRNGSFSVLAGPYFAFAMGGKNKFDYTESFDGESESESGSTDLKFGTGENSHLKGTDFGLNIGVGYETFINSLPIQANLTYQMGLANVSPDTTGNSTTKNNVISISFIYFLFEK